MNILMPLAGKNQFFPQSDYPFPKPLIEFCGKSMIEHVIANFEAIRCSKQYIFVVNEDDCKKYYLDNVLSMLTNHSCKVIKVRGETKGAACSAMLAVEYINNNSPLVIANADQYFDINLQSVIEAFSNADAGVVTFESVHPRWSYVRLEDDSNKVVEAAEKKPISKEAIAGFYYYKRGESFISAAQRMIKKDSCIDGLYYVSPSINELVLQNKQILAYKIKNEQYHTFYSPQKIQEFERKHMLGD